MLYIAANNGNEIGKKSIISKNCISSSMFSFITHYLYVMLLYFNNIA